MQTAKTFAGRAVILLVLSCRSSNRASDSAFRPLVYNSIDHKYNHHKLGKMSSQALEVWSLNPLKCP